MKKIFKTFQLFLACTAMLFMYSCQLDDAVSVEASGIEFVFSGDRVSDDKIGAKSMYKNGESCDMALASYAIIIMDETSYTIDLKSWGDNFKTDLIELPPGSYEVTSSQLYDADDNLLYSTPMTESEFGKFVSQSLPFRVEVENYRKIEYDLEVLCIEEFTPPQFDIDDTDCETAYAFGNNTFIDLELTNARWGWANEFTNVQDGTYTLDIWAGAGQNNLSSGTLVGLLTIEVSGSDITVTYDMDNGFTMNETHLYLGDSEPSTIAPGGYGNTHDLNSATSDSFTVSYSGDGDFWIIAHAVVCE